MRKLLRILNCMAFVAAFPAFAQTPAEVVANALIADGVAPAATAGLATVDDMSFSVAGLRVLDGEVRAEPDDAWHLGSITKSMTAVLAARLVDAGEITWDTTVRDVLAAAYPDMDAAWGETTLRALLTHRSGMGPNLSRGSTRDLGEGPRTLYVEEMLFYPPEGTPGDFLYSNAGYVVAGAMLEAAGGASWEDQMQAQVFTPLGLESAGFGPPQDGIEGHRTRLLGGIRAVGQGFEADNIPAMGPAGRVHMATDDVLRYLRAHLIRDEAFLSTGAWTELHQPVGEEAYAMGWGVDEDGSLVHSGSNTLWYAVVFVDPAAGEAAFVAVNSGDFEAVVEPLDQALRQVLSAP